MTPKAASWRRSNNMEPKDPVVSIVITTFNRSKLLIERAVASVQAQTYKDWECIVVDDESTDDTEARMGEVVARDPRVRYFKIKNSGLSAARNFGIKAARGEYVGFTDDDDAYLPDYLEEATKIFRRLPSDVGYLSGAAYNVDDKGLRSYMKPPLDPIWRSPVGNGWIFRRGAFFDQDIFFDEQLKNVEDLDMRIRLDRAGYKGYVIDRALREYFINLASKDPNAWSKNYTRQLEQFNGFFRKNEDVYRAFGPAALAWLYYLVGMTYARAGMMAEAKKMLGDSYRNDPSFIVFINWCAVHFGHRAFMAFDHAKDRAMRFVRAHFLNPPKP